ncbi:MAG: hypothetical protein KDK25_14925, partial [Leptospiraceae bacterium]|nr:hypothetical protein [Leptospiraceae bacterium]
MQEHLQNIIDNPSFLNEASLEVKETHISTVLIGENVYKFKKPIRLDFVDQESLESRALLCFEEWRLNRRLSPRVYLGVDLLARKEDRLKLFPWPGLEREPPAFSIVLSEVESHGWTVQDICVRMEHLADANRLEEKVSELDASDMDRLAEKIASFHRSLPSRPPSSGFG